MGAAATVVLLTGDLLFGSKVESLIRAADAEPVFASSVDEAMAAARDRDARLLVVDLVGGGYDLAALTRSSAVPVLGYYAHTDDDTRTTALAAGFAKVVPRSRMAREGAELIAAMLAV